MNKGKSDLGTRAIVALALIGLAAVALWAGGLGFWLVVAAIALLMMPNGPVFQARAGASGSCRNMR